MMKMILLWVFVILSSSLHAADPTRPPAWLTSEPRAVAPVSQRSLNLQQILVRDTQRFAVINDEILAVGDRIKQATVIAIDQTSVTLKTTKNRFVLSLLESASVSEVNSGRITKPAVKQQSEYYGK